MKAREYLALAVITAVVAGYVYDIGKQQHEGIIMALSCIAAVFLCAAFGSATAWKNGDSDD